MHRVGALRPGDGLFLDLFTDKPASEHHTRYYPRCQVCAESIYASDIPTGNAGYNGTSGSLQCQCSKGAASGEDRFHHSQCHSEWNEGKRYKGKHLEVDNNNAYPLFARQQWRQILPPTNNDMARLREEVQREKEGMGDHPLWQQKMFLTKVDANLNSLERSLTVPQLRINNEAVAQRMHQFELWSQCKENWQEQRRYKEGYYEGNISTTGTTKGNREDTRKH